MPDSPTPFVHLHNHSEYSLLDGAAKINEMVDTAAKMGMPAVALTDHGNMFGAYKFYHAAKERGVKPIIGCEVYVAKGERMTHSGGDDQFNHLVLLAEDDAGYSNLSHLVSLGYIEGFYYKPRIDKEILARHGKGLIGLSACLKGIVPQKFAQGQPEAALAEAVELRDILGEGNFYLELQDHGIEDQRRVNPSLVAVARKHGFPLVCTNDTHYMRREDCKAHDILLCIGTGKLESDEKRMRYSSDQFYFKSHEEMRALFQEVPDALENTVRIAERCNVELKKIEEFPPFPLPEGHDYNSYFEEIAREGYARRRRHLERLDAAGALRHPLGEYDKRLEDEVGMIERMGFASYFLLVWDLFRHAREEGIPVGPGRGSVVGSLVAYSMDITDVDPLQYSLYFERFLNPERYSPPDIDMDFCTKRRQEVIDYATAKYGKECVCQIITFGKMLAKGVLRDVGRVLGVPLQDVNRIAKLVPNELKMTLDKALAAEPRIKEEMAADPKVAEMVEIGRRLEGLSRNPGKHAAGVVISPRPLIDIIPLYKPSNEDTLTTQYNMGDLETIGLLKMDFLGLATLTVIKDTLRFVKEATGEEVNLSELPLDDPEVYALFSAGRTNGLFQFESGGMKSALQKLQPNRFEDLIAMNALYRPGPMDNIPLYTERRHGAPVKYPHPLLKDVLEETYGIFVYQEQAMLAARVVAGYTLGGADILRRVMSKKKEKEMAKHRVLFVEGAARVNGLAARDANAIFDLLVPFANYGFNKSHATAYALLAYQTAWLKVHHPVEFMAALLSQKSWEGKTDDVVLYKAECREMGIDVLPPDVNHSERDFMPRDGKIRYGLLAIRNVGAGAIDIFLECRKKGGRFRSLFHFCSEVDAKVLNKRTMESLVKAGAFDSLGKRSQCWEMLEAAIEYGLKAGRDRESGQKGLFASMSDTASALPEPTPPDIPEWDEQERIRYEKEMLGFYVTGHPLNRFSAEIERYSKKTLAELVECGEKVECTVAGIVTGFQKKRTKKGDLMGVFKLEDFTGSVEVLVFPSDYDACEKFMEEDYPVLVTGTFEIEEADVAEDSEEDEGGKGKRGRAEGKILVSGIQPLEGIIESHAQKLRITADVARLTPDTAGSLNRLFQVNDGKTGVEVELRHPDGFMVNIKSADYVKVRSSLALIRQIERLCGQGSVQIVA
ncbi:MAG: DNA polymerase III subunit alpha [Acidobacteriota bacterium]|nr:DNA polymerase III subunit alpha [Acidobacteriota bacterium]